MPKLIEEKEIVLEFTDIGKRVIKTRESSMLRSSGIHLSGVIRYALRKAGLMQPEDRDEDMPLIMLLGMFWEEGIVTFYPSLIWQPGEVERDGIFGSPDGITKLADGVTRLEEFKFTKKSYWTHKGDMILEERLWMWQLMGYCSMMGLNLIRLHVCWDCGNYRDRRMPFYSTYVIEFSDEELARFWQNIILVNKHGAVAEEHG